MGENRNGCLGTNDIKKRVNAGPIQFFDDKRVIDFACGDRFSVFIAEVYEEREKSPVRKPKIKMVEEKLQSSKMDIKSTRQSICGGGYGAIPLELKTKIEDMLTKRSKRRDASVDHARKRSPLKKEYDDPYETGKQPSLPILSKNQRNRDSMPELPQHNRQLSGILLNRNAVRDINLRLST